MWLTLVLVIFGIFGGILTGLLGIGSGIIYVFILPYALKYYSISSDVIVQYTIANSFFGMMLASFSANITNYLHKDMFWKESLWVSIPGAIMALILMKSIVIQPWYSYDIFSLLLIIFLFFILISYHAKRNKQFTRNTFSFRLLGLSGLVSGSLSALTGLGGGGILIPILSFRYYMDIKRAKSISLVMIFIISFLLTIFNLIEEPIKSFSELQEGYIFFPVAIPLSLGVIFGSPAGVKLSHKLSSRTISIIFSLLIIVVIIEKLIQLF